MKFESKIIQWTVLITLAFVWGSSFILMKRGLESFSNTQVASLRLLIACLFLIPFGFPHIKLLLGKKAPFIIAVGVLGNGIPAFLFTKAQMGLSSALTGMLNSLTPLFTLLLGVAVFHMKIKFHNVLGIFIGLLGAAGLIYANTGANLFGDFKYASFVVLATVLYAFSVNIIKRHLAEVPSVQIASLAFMFVGPFAGIYLFAFTDFTEVFKQAPKAWSSLGYISVLAVMGSALSVIVFNMLIKKTSAIFAASVTYIIPVFAMLWGIFDGETITFNQILFIGVILAGVYLVNKRELKLFYKGNKKESMNLGG
jgi:drug/metabolite transporter (DMT)-like permease